LIVLALLAWSSVDAQNLLRNPDFEEPLGPDNWTIVYAPVLNGPNVAPTECTRSDFYICGRTRLAHKDLVPGTWDGEDGTGTNYWSKFGLHFCASHDWLMHVYARQVVSGLMPGSNYTATCWITQFDPGAVVDKVKVYLEVLGGPDGTSSQRSPDVMSTVLGTPTNWTKCVVSQTASDDGQIEIQLHYNKNGSTANDKWRNMDALYDHASLMLTGQPDYLPPYNMTSVVRTNQDLALTWESVMNNRYRIQATTNPSDPYAWVMLERERNLDPNLVATGPSFTFTTNVSSLFYYDPPYVKVPQYFDPSAPLFFRIYSEPFVP